MKITNYKLVGLIVLSVLSLLTLTIFAFETNHSTYGLLGTSHYTIQEALDNASNNNTTHPWLTIRAIEHSGVTFSNDATTNNQIKKWIVQGSIEEDIGIAGVGSGDYGFAETSWLQYNYIHPSLPPPGQADGPSYSPILLPGHKLLYQRAENHFLPSILGRTFITSDATDAYNWAFNSSLNHRDWTDGLSSSATAETKWKSLGHVLHVVEDMGVPAHGRADIHPSIINADNFEGWAGSRDLIFWDTTSPLFAGAYRSVKTGLLNITPNLTDIDAFSTLEGAITNLRKYTATNYVSDDTIVKEDTASSPTIPKLPLNASSTDFIYNSKSIPIPIVEKGFLYKYDRWWGFSHTEIVNWATVGNHLVPGYFYISDTVSEAMWQDIAPKVIAVAAEVIKMYVSGATANTGTISGSVKDAVTRNNISGVTISIYSGSTLITTKTTDSNGVYTATLSPGTYSLTISKTGYITENVSNIAVQANVTTNVESVLQVSSSYSGTGSIAGTIKNAFDGIGVSGATINIRSGIGVTSGTVVKTATTASDGAYTIAGLNAGNYTAEVSKSGYTTACFTVTSIGGQTNTNQNFSITPVIATGQTRIVLTWGSTPYDLDSHLTGPGSTRFHVYFSSQGSSTSSPYAELDTDDTDGYGPETITIYQQSTGIYRYSVHDFSNDDSSSSTALSNSGAQVKVYRGSTLSATYNVPANQGGTLWTVFELSGTTLTPINTMTYESNSYNVRSVTPPDDSPSDAELIRNLPRK